MFCGKFFTSFTNVIYGFGYFFQAGASEEEKEQYHKLMSEVGWFFFNLLILGYIEDPFTGESFHFPGGLSWKLYIEVIT